MPTHTREMGYLWAQVLKTGTIQSPDKKELLWCFSVQQSTEIELD